jgi:hypothetical protein
MAIAVPSVTEQKDVATHLAMIEHGDVAMRLALIKHEHVTKGLR